MQQHMHNDNDNEVWIGMNVRILMNVRIQIQKYERNAHTLCMQPSIAFSVSVEWNTHLSIYHSILK